MTKKKLTKDDLKVWEYVTRNVTKLNEPRKPVIPTEQNYSQLITTLDLHGYTLQEAFDTVISYLDLCYTYNVKSVTIITGKGKGDATIRREFPHWLEHPVIVDKVSEYQELNQGAFRIKIKAKRT